MSIFNDGYKTLTYNALFNFIIGNRGGGKTYWSKRWAVNDFIKNGNQFIYVRRYKAELRTAKTFFNDIGDEFPGHSFEVKGTSLMVDDKKAGEVMALSTSKIMKSNSYPKVNKIIFDEFIIDKGVYKYLPNEVEYFLDLYETISRLRDVKVFFLANAITQTNPYFIYFDIELPYNKKTQTFYNNGTGRFVKKKNKPYPDVLIELVRSEEFIAEKKKQRFGQLIAGTQYSDYAVENEFLRDSSSFIEKKSERCRYLYSITYTGFTFGVWHDFKNGILYLSNDREKENKINYAFTTDDHKLNTMLVSTIRTSGYLKQLFDGFKMGFLRFESMDIKNIFHDLLKEVSI